MLFNTKIANKIPYAELGKAFYYGLRLDISTACYFSVIPLFGLILAHFTANNTISKLIKLYSIIVVILVCIVSLIDAQLYEYWGQKLNAYASSFAKFPKEMFSFSSGISYAKLIFFVFLIFFIVSTIFDNLVLQIKNVATKEVSKIKLFVFFIISAAILFLGIRGSIGMSPINQSFAYYSTTPFCNHAATNTIWNFIATLVDNSEDEKRNPYSTLPQEEADKIVNKILKQPAITQKISWTDKKQPDIVLIILEGWTADVIKKTGGESNVTPNMNNWATNSLLYTNFYANGNRTDKGLASILSAEPSLAKSSIINKLQKYNNLPALPKNLAKAGYHNKFVYGGESEFANMKAYWINSGFTNIIDIHQFDKAILPESWGVHDNVLFDKLLNEINNTPSPKFISALTLSSHEPYDVPHSSIFKEKTQADMYRNAVHFADEALGNFLASAAKSNWYDNTLIIILSDHGHYQPLNRNPYQPERFHIPCWITGGALNKNLQNKIVSKISDQTDLTPTILEQLGLSNKDYKWGKSMLDTLSKNGLATYTFNDGIGFITKEGFVVYDAESKKIILNEGKNKETLSIQAQAFLQTHYNDYLQR